MANNMQSFDFNALDSTTLDETLSFLNNYDPTPLPDPSFAGFEGFGEPMMDWPFAENELWGPLGNADLFGGVTNALTDNSILGFQFLNPGTEFEGQPYQPHHGLVADTPLDFGESRYPQNSHARPVELSTIRESFPQGSEHDVSFPEESTPSMDKMPLLCLACDWPSCKSVTVYGTIRELQNHQTDVHIANVMNAWPGSCSWPGCNSKIIFRTSKRLESHVYNIHVTPLCCTITGCDHKRPFERQADLERHIVSKHTAERKYKCPHPLCVYKASFSRKDKLKHHERCYHGQFTCSRYHCIYGFPSEYIAWKHEMARSYHGYYECMLGSCGSFGSIVNSEFTLKNLYEHLVHDHLISSKAVEQAVKRSDFSGALTLDHFPEGFSAFQDCKSCIQKLKQNASGKEGTEEN